MKKIIRKAVDGALLALDIADAPEYVVEKPKDPRHGDLAVNVAFLLARRLRKKPALIATEIVARLDLDGSHIDKIEVAPNGFINFRISSGWSIDRLARIQQEGENYGRNNSLAGQRIVVEFVSSNPTGPLTVGHGRQAVLGDCISGLLEACGAEVTREYYYNDAGNQMNSLGRSLFARYARRWDPDFPFPENGYQGEYLIAIAEQFAKEHAERYLPQNRQEQTPEQVLKIFREYAAERIRRVIDRDLQRFRIRFDLWSLESRLYTEGNVENLLKLLKEKGLSYEKDGAVWFCTSQFGDDEDRVIVKKTGEPTYFLPDLA
ncbi:MAG TPA: arginine--tRNA ligase, partial [Candidatus Glassbacteria bacterium]|nr:arginine--tRNA ligase [Candidatus Glassbacteria bacterium]